MSCIAIVGEGEGIEVVIADDSVNYERGTRYITDARPLISIAEGPSIEVEPIFKWQECLFILNVV